MDYSLDELLEQYRKHQRGLGGSPYGDKRENALKGIFETLRLLEGFPLPCVAGDRVFCKSHEMEGTVIFADDGCVVVFFDNGITFEAYNAYQSHTRLVCI